MTDSQSNFDTSSTYGKVQFRGPELFKKKGTLFKDEFYLLSFFGFFRPS